MLQKVMFHEHGSPVNVLRTEKGPEPASPGLGQVLVKFTKLLTRLVAEIASNTQSDVLRITTVDAITNDQNTFKMEACGVLLSVAGSTVASRLLQILKAQGFTAI